MSFKDSELIVLSWIPWSGKTTFLEKNILKNWNIEKNANYIKNTDLLWKEYYIISSDYIRKHKWINGGDKNRNKEVFDTLMVELQSILLKAQNDDKEIIVFLDFTATTSKERIQYFTLAKDKFKIKTKLIMFLIHPALAFENVSNRSLEDINFIDDEEVIRFMFWKFSYPNKKEKKHIDNIEIIKTFDNKNKDFKKYVEDIEKETLNFLSNKNDSVSLRWFFVSNFEYEFLEDIDKKKAHISKYHQEWLEKHWLNVVEEGIKNNYDNTSLLALLFHDLWKVYSYKKKEDWWYIFQWHEEKSALLFDMMTYYFSDTFKRKFSLDKVYYIVKYHNFFQKKEIKDIILNNDLSDKEIKNKIKEEFIKLDLDFKEITDKEYDDLIKYFIKQFEADKNGARPIKKVEKENDILMERIKKILL